MGPKDVKDLMQGNGSSGASRPADREEQDDSEGKA
jgi:hypothetical protein